VGRPVSVEKWLTTESPVSVEKWLTTEGPISVEKWLNTEGPVSVEKWFNTERPVSVHKWLILEPDSGNTKMQDKFASSTESKVVRNQFYEKERMHNILQL
jgi:hypothetical protein